MAFNTVRFNQHDRHCDNPPVGKALTGELSQSLLLKYSQNPLHGPGGVCPRSPAPDTVSMNNPKSLQPSPSSLVSSWTHTKGAWTPHSYHGAYLLMRG